MNNTYNKTYEQELAMIRDPNRWPCWPQLPLKHRRKKEKDIPNMALLGVLIDGTTTVIEGCMFQISDDSPKHEYASVEAILRDWEID